MRLVPAMPLVALVLAALPLAAPAQTLPDLGRRVGKLEGDMRAVKRRVLPDDEAALIEPETTPGAAITPAGPTPVQVLADRVDALERQQRALTATIEEQGFKLRQTSDDLVRLRTDAEARLARIEAAAAPPAPLAEAAPPPTRTPLSPLPPATAPPRATPEAQFQAAYALVQAKDWSNAEQALTSFIARYPKQPRASHARYWLGRSYYSQGQFDRAARTHFDNYQADVRGERAQESLFWVGRSLLRLKRAPEACKVYELAAKNYADEMKPELKPQFAAARLEANCS